MSASPIRLASRRQDAPFWVAYCSSDIWGQVMVESALPRHRTGMFGALDFIARLTKHIPPKRLRLSDVTVCMHHAQRGGGRNTLFPVEYAVFILRL